jgi:hypothetical protein
MLLLRCSGSLGWKERPFHCRQAHFLETGAPGLPPRTNHRICVEHERSLRAYRRNEHEYPRNTDQRRFTCPIGRCQKGSARRLIANHLGESRWSARGGISGRSFGEDGAIDKRHRQFGCRVRK